MSGESVRLNKKLAPENSPSLNGGKIPVTHTNLHASMFPFITFSNSSMFIRFLSLYSLFATRNGKSYSSIRMKIGSTIFGCLAIIWSRYCKLINMLLFSEKQF